MEIKIAEDYTEIPSGKINGFALSINHIIPAIYKSKKSNEKLKLNLDGTYGYSTVFLKSMIQTVIDFYGNGAWKDIEIISKEEPYLIQDINNYIKEAENVD